MKHLRKSLILLALGTSIVFVLFAGTVFAVTSIAKGYITNDSDLRTGMAVALSSESNGERQYVTRVSVASKEKYIGIVTQIDDSALTISEGNSTVYVSNSGKHDVIVSDVNGDVKKGDLLIVSPLKGYLMKMTNEDKNNTSVAVALNNLDISKSTEDVKLSDGQTKSVHVGRVSAEVSTNTVYRKDNKLLSTIGESLTGHNVSVVRIIMACAILFVVLVVDGAIVYSAISSSILAIGRNPLSKKSVYTQVWQASVIAFFILVFGAVGIYVVIWT